MIPCFANAVSPSINDIISLTDCLHYFTYLKDHSFYGLNSETHKIYAELKSKAEVELNLFATGLLKDPQTLDRFIETATQTSKESLLPLILELTTSQPGWATESLL